MEALVASFFGENMDTKFQSELKTRLQNYKEMHKKLAEQKGILSDFLMAKTLTQARKILFGKKEKNHSAFRGHPNW